MSQEQPVLLGLQFQVRALERDMQDIKEQLKTYVPVSINDLNLQAIRKAVERMEMEVSGIKKQIDNVKDTMDKRDNEQRESQDKLQIRAMWGAIGFGLSVIGGVAVVFFGHFIGG